MKIKLTLLLAVVLSACASREPWDGQVQRWGKMREVMRDAQTEGRVELASLGPHACGVGALEGLAGEVTVLDGRVWVTRAPTVDRLETEQDPEVGRATLLAVGHVPQWTEQRIARSVPPDAFDDFVRKAAQTAGLDTSRPFPFAVEGAITDLSWHVIRGACPHRPVPTTPGDAPPPPFRRDVSESTARLVGIYAENAAGVLTHRGRRTHVHVLVDDGHNGHVDRAGIAAGATLMLPAVADR